MNNDTKTTKAGERTQDSDTCPKCGSTTCSHSWELLARTQHTPGPWMIYGDGKIGSASVRRFPDMTVIQPGTVKGETIATAMANARLIAAAPDLLEAIQDFEAWASEVIGMNAESMSLRNLFLDKARAAIAKAEGSR
jgi:hypothetical protein